MTETVLVTGATGFVGGWTIARLLQRGYRVRGTVRDLSREPAARAAVGREADAGDRLDLVAADLGADAGWAEAVRGCAAVLHIASPMSQVGEEADLIAAARDGTLRVLRAAVEARVPRVVVTSSTAACTPEPPPTGRPIDERDWTDPEQPGLSGYRKSKVLAERAAWAFMEGQATTLTTILPGAIFGPVLDRTQLGSVSFIKRLLDGQPPALPRLAFNIIDVRDLADLHIAAMLAPEAAGRRFIAMGDALWYLEMAQALRDRLGEAAAAVPTQGLPDDVFRAMAETAPQMKALLPLLGRTQKFSRQAAEQVLGFQPRSPQDTVADTGASLLD